MRLIGVIKDPQQADKLAAWLLTNDIETKLEAGRDDKTEIWVRDEDLLEQAKSELKAFEENPDDPRYTAARGEAERLLKEKQKKARAAKKNMVKVRAGETSRRVGPMTRTVIFLCLIVAIFTRFGDPQQLEQGANRALQFVALDPPAAAEFADDYLAQKDSLNLRLASLKRGEVWRLITPIFIHYSFFHFLFNMLWFLQFGRMIENRYGTVWLAILVLVVAAVSNLAQGIAPVGMGGSPPVPSSGILITHFGGLSGVVYGLFGFILVKQFTDRSSGFFLPQLTIVILLAFLVFCMLPIASESFGMSIANWCHGVGFLAGVVMGQIKR